MEAFIRYAQEHPKRKVFIGIDPGTTGALGFVCGDANHVEDIPTITVKRGKKNRTEADYPACLDLFARSFWKEQVARMYCLIEQPPPTMGPGHAYADVIVNRMYAIWPLFIMEKGFHFEEVAPNEWKKVMGLSPDKENSRKKAQGMFPGASLARKKDHNRAEALLLAEYHRRKLLGRL